MTNWRASFLGSWRLSVIALLTGALLAGNAVWQFQAMRYTGRIDHLQADLKSYQAAVATANAKLVQAQAQVVTKVEVRYRDRIKIVKEKGDTLIKEIPVYVTPQDTAHFGVNIGFVRLYNAAFSRIPAGAPAQSDREPARISLIDVARTTAFNATVCQQWQAQALGWRQFYRQLQKTYFPEN